jgi:hypothetical protein
MAEREEHPWKALSPIDPSKALSPIDVTESGIVTAAREEHPSKA